MKIMKKLSRLISVVLILSALCGMTVFADSGNVHFDFPMREINLAPGDEFHMYVWASDAIHGCEDIYTTYSIYMIPDKAELGKSKDTYLWSNFTCGNSYVDIYIGEDEVNTGFTLYFYMDKMDEYDTINVHIVTPENSDVPYTKKNATRKLMGLEPEPVSSQERLKLVMF